VRSIDAYEYDLIKAIKVSHWMSFKKLKIALNLKNVFIVVTSDVQTLHAVENIFSLSGH